MTVYYHGGVSGKQPGDLLVPSPPHVEDGCPICRARAEGRTLRVGEYRRWAERLGAPGLRILRSLGNVPDYMPIDAPTSRVGVYLTSDRDYARWYAARSRGDLYEAVPVGACRESFEDPFPSWSADSATVVRVIERGVRLDRRFRRTLKRRWAKADRRRGVRT